MAKLPVKIRDFRDEDLNFILNSWLKSFKPSYYAGSIPDDMYWDVYESVFRRILKNSDVNVACDPESEYTIYGYSVTEDLDVPVVHWIYVKQPFRSLGIAKDLVNASDLFNRDSYYTFRVADCKMLCSPEGLLPRARFNQSPVRRKR
jgi:GNAT superfamily N-acetyltransferase